MNPIHYRNNALYIEECSLQEIAKSHGTPCFVYSKQALEQTFGLFKQALGEAPHQICYAVKANSNLTLLRLLVSLGSGFDIVSLGELQSALKAGADPKQVVFSGVGKQDFEIIEALKQGIGCFNIESEEELLEVHQLAEHLQIKAPIALRVNPDIDAQSHPYIATGLHTSKFGIPFSQAFNLYARTKAMPFIEVKGVACHIGSQITDLAPFSAAAERVSTFVERLQDIGLQLEHIDMGGGLGVCYQNETPPTPTDYIQALRKGLKHSQLSLWIEPGRALIAEAGALITQVVRLKQNEGKHFCITDAGMNDLIRPALYQAEHAIWPVRLREEPSKYYDVVGPICETGDILGANRALATAAKDYLAILTCGAYGYSMSSNYNSRGRAAEVLVSGNQAQSIRRRETQDDLWATEDVLKPPQKRD